MQMHAGGFLRGGLLPLLLGEVAERSEDGEGRRCKALSATCGDSSPGGRAKQPSQPPAAAALPDGEPRTSIKLEKQNRNPASAVAILKRRNAPSG